VIAFVPEMDIMFNSRGTVEGELLAMGAIHLPLADVGDLANGFRIEVAALKPSTADPTILEPAAEAATDAQFREANDEAIISVFTRTGGIVINSPDPTDDGADGFRDDVWRFAETGGDG